MKDGGKQGLGHVRLFILVKRNEKMKRRGGGGGGHGCGENSVERGGKRRKRKRRKKVKARESLQLPCLERLTDQIILIE